MASSAPISNPDWENKKGPRMVYRQYLNYKGPQFPAEHLQDMARILGEGKLAELLERLIAPLAGLSKIALPTLEGLEFIQLDEVVRMEAEGSYTRIFFTNKKTIMATRKLREFEEMLPQQQFFRIHRSHIINLHHLVRYFRGKGGYVVMVDGAQLDVSKRKKEQFLEKLNLV